MASRFSWELMGSNASLLGIGVTVETRFTKDRALDLDVVSCRHDDAAAALLALVVFEAGVAPFDAAFEKKPRMLCCFAAEDEMVLLPVLLFFLAVAGALAGVLARRPGFSPILDGLRTDW